MTQRTAPGRLERLVPIVGFLRRYDRTLLRSDLVAGLTVAVMLVPQSMAYASLAGMPPVTGLYASVVPLVVYALLGTSGALAVGPVAITALMTAGALGPLADGDPARYAALAGLLALMVGLIQVLLGILRMGVLVNFMSHSVLSGFTSAAAIVIASSQVKDLLGLDAERGEVFPEIAEGTMGAIDTVHWLTVVVGAVSIAGLLLMRRWWPRLPAALAVVTLVTLASAAVGLGDRDVKILKDVPSGLPAPAIPELGTGDIVDLLPSALAIALVAYMEGIAVAKAIAAKTRQRVNANQELVAVGAANAAAGLFQSFPVAGGFSRSAVNHQAGAKTPVATLVTAGVVALAVTLLTPLFYHLPKAVLAAIVVVAVLGLVDAKVPVTAWRARRVDGVAVGVTFLATLAFGVEPGLLVGVVYSIGVFLWRSASPHTADLGRVPGTDVYRNVSRWQGLVTDPRVAILRVDGPLYFANAQRLEEEMLELAERSEHMKAVVLDASAISDTDADGAHALGELHERLADRGVRFHLATVRGPVRDLLCRAGVAQRFEAAGALHRDVHTSVRALGLDESSPLRRVEEPDHRLVGSVL